MNRSELTGRGIEGLEAGKKKEVNNKHVVYFLNSWYGSAQGDAGLMVFLERVLADFVDGSSESDDFIGDLRRHVESMDVSGTEKGVPEYFLEHLSMLERDPSYTWPEDREFNNGLLQSMDDIADRMLEEDKSLVETEYGTEQQFNTTRYDILNTARKISGGGPDNTSWSINKRNARDWPEAIAAEVLEELEYSSDSDKEQRRTPVTRGLVVKILTDYVNEIFSS